jgi:hypothetical protein
VVILLDVPGRTYEKKGSVDGLVVNSNDKSIKVHSSFKNEGNIHLDVSAEVNIRRVDTGISLAAFSIQAINDPGKKAFIFPGAIRDFEGDFERQLPAGDYLAEISYNYGYSFRQAKAVKKFTIVRKNPLNETQAHFLAVKDNNINLSLPENSMRVKIIKISNMDYRPLNVTPESDGKLVKTDPQTITLKPGEERNIRIMIKVSKYLEPSMTDIVTLKTDRGKSEVISISVRNTDAANANKVESQKVKK